MIVLVVIVVALVAAGAALAVSASDRIVVDPIDPAAEEAAAVGAIERHPRVARFLSRRMDRSAASGLLLTVSAAVTVAVIAGLGLILRLINRSNSLARADAAISRWGADHATSWTVPVLERITWLGSTPVVILGLIAVGVVDHMRRRTTDTLVFLLVVGLGQNALNNAVKLIVGRRRPDVLHLVSAHGSSFPSGHSCGAAAWTCAAALVLSRGWLHRRRAVAAGVAVLVAMSVASSRALLGVHWVSDVLGGLALGWGWFTLVAIVFGGRRLRVGGVVDDAASQLVENENENESNAGHESARVGGSRR